MGSPKHWNFQEGTRNCGCTSLTELKNIWVWSLALKLTLHISSQFLGPCSKKNISKRLKKATFQNLLITHPKLITHKINVYSTILGGCWREKVVSSIFRFERSKFHFWAPENGHFWRFWPKLPIFRCPKLGLQAPKYFWVQWGKYNHNFWFPLEILMFSSPTFSLCPIPGSISVISHPPDNPSPRPGCWAQLQGCPSAPSWHTACQT